MADFTHIVITALDLMYKTKREVTIVANTNALGGDNLIRASVNLTIKKLEQRLEKL